MRTTTLKTLLWTPRLLAILAALSLTTFALDAFSEPRGFWASMPDFLLHLVPSFMLFGTVFIAWRREWFGALIFLSFATVYVVTMLDHPAWVLSVPLGLIGLMYLLSWRIQPGS